MRGKLTECIQLAATTSPTGVLFTGEKYPKAAGDTGAEGPFQGQTPPFPRTPFKDAACGGAIQAATVFESSCSPVRCPVCRSPSARAELPSQTCERLQFNYFSQCRPKSLRYILICA